MNPTILLCKASNIVLDPWIFYLAGLFIFFLIVVRLLFQSFKYNLSIFSRIISTFMAIISFLAGAFVFGILVLFTFGYIDDHPPSSDYHALNAMIKNRCFVDADKQYCPKTAEEVIALAPDETKRYLPSANITYSFNSKENYYTLIVRNDIYVADNRRAVLFDPRLIKEKNYGRNGLDFFDVDIENNCDGTFRIKNPPPFKGQWNQIK